MENVMQGIIDMHIHAAPDVRARKLDDLELMEASVQRGVRAIVLKSHNFPTADRAYLVNRVAAEKYPDAKFTAFGGLCLNHPAGGLNPDAVETSLKLGAKVIWLPTNTAENHYRKNGKDPSKGVVVTRDGKAVSVTIKDMNGNPLDENKQYKVGMNSYIASSYRFDHADPGHEMTATSSDALIEYLKQQKEITPQQPRTSIVEE